MGGTHTDSEGIRITERIPDHPKRTESADFRKAKSIAAKIMATLERPPYGPGPWQMHHAGSLWVLDEQGWFLLLNTLGGEWSAQWCGKPEAYDFLRLTAERTMVAFPLTVPELIRLGYGEAPTILHEPITDAAGIARWTDSLFNSCVPLAASVHTGLRPAETQAFGWHAGPKSIWDIQFTKQDDFVLFVADPAGHTVAVAPVSPRGSGDGRVQVIHADPGSLMGRQKAITEAMGEPLVLDADHPVAQAAFRNQG